MDMNFSFQKNNTFDKRQEESLRIKAKYPDRIPIICEVSKNHKDKLILDKNKYLVPGDITVGQFVYIIRKRIKLSPEKAVYLFTERGTLPVTASLMSSVYKEYGNVDGFLYLNISSESTFGQ
jgi:GABA(A) receptor-associated protein